MALDINSIKRPFPSFLAAWATLYQDTGLPKSFVYWSGIFTIAACLQDNVWVADGNRKTKPNMYLWFVAPSGSGKSETAAPAIELLQTLTLVDVYTGQLTALALIKHLGGSRRITNIPSIIPSPKLVMYSDELATSLGPPSMADELMKALTQMYNRSYTYTSDRQGTIHVNDPCISWLACCSPPWLLQSIPRNMVNAGFIARVICVYETLGPERVATGVSSSTKLRSALIADMARMTLLKGEYMLTPDAARVRQEWGNEQLKARRAFSDDTKRDMYGREEEHVIKVAMCLTASNGNDLIITERSFINAARYVLNAKNSSVDILLSISSTTQVNLKFYLLNVIRDSGPIIQERDLRAKTHRRIDDNQTFYRLVSSLQQEGLIEVNQASDNAPRIYRALIAPTGGGD